MTKMVFDGWENRFLKVSSTKLFQEHFGLGLKQAKEKTDDLLKGKAFALSIENLEDSQSALRAFLQIGALCHLE
ncbi:hypothetical protein GCM10028774_66130 [Spirosoma jeollabukense]